MELELRDGKVKWIKKDGTPSERNVSLKRELDVLGFNPRGGVKLILGDPYEDDHLVAKCYPSNGSYPCVLFPNGRSSALPWNMEDLIDEGVLTLENASTIAAELAGNKEVETVPADRLADETNLLMNELPDGGYYNAKHRVRVSDWPEGWTYKKYREVESDAIDVLKEGPYWTVRGYQDPEQSTRRKILGRVAPDESMEKVRKMLHPFSDVKEVYKNSEIFQELTESWPRLDREVQEEVRDIVREADPGEE